MWRSLSKSLLGVTLPLALLAAAAWAVNGQPPLPMHPYGVVYINGEPAEDGTLVEAKIGGEVVAFDYTFTADGEKGHYTLYIEGEEGDTVRLFVVDIEAEESPRSWLPGRLRVDLHVRRAQLAAEATAPETATVGTTFGVSATVTNVATGDGRAISVTVTLDITGTALLVEGETLEKPIGDLGAGVSSSPVTWTLRCGGGGPAVARVTPGGIEQRTGSPIPEDYLASDEATVLQRFVIRLFPMLRSYSYAR